jgi:hypothetical protein
LNKNKIFSVALVFIALITGFLFYNKTTLNYSLAKTGYEVMQFNRKNELMNSCLSNNKVPLSKYLECEAASSTENTEWSNKPEYYACLAKEAPACRDIYFVTIENLNRSTWRDEVEDNLHFISYYLTTGYSTPAKSWLYLFTFLLTLSFICIYKYAVIYAWLKK